ncbi:BamA/TamA family outer membrane protein [Mucilaginibacter sp. AW1-3]
MIQTHGACYGQQKPKPQDTVSRVDQIDLFDVLRKLTKKPKKTTADTPGYEIKIKNVSLLPILGYSPANGAVAGAAISITKLMGDPRSTQLSTLLTNVSFTTKNQTLLNLKFDIYTQDNKWYITGDNRLLFFSQATYGLGIKGLAGQPHTFSWNGISATTHGELEQPLQYNYLRLYENFLRKITNKWYAGIGVMIDSDTKIRDDSLRLDAPVYLTSHYIYSKNYGFDPAQYVANGLSFQVMHDSRDNPVNPYKGTYVNFSFRVNPQFLGSSQNSTQFYCEYRTYIGVNKAIPQNLIAFWLWGSGVTSGHLPYLDLPAITWDTYNRSGRGYIQGRFRGNTMIYGESEFRFRITGNGFLGGVTFVNITTASNPLPYVNQSLFDAVAPGCGVGLRIKMNKADRTNITVDYGMGDGFSGLYLNIREAF